MYAVEAHRPDLLEWLLTEGFDANATDDFGQTPLFLAAQNGDAVCVDLLLQAGADPKKGPTYSSPIEEAHHFVVVRQLLAAGEDLRQISDEVRQELLGVTPGDPRATKQQYQAGKHPRFGRSNPERMENPFWRAMVHAGCNAYFARRLFEDTDYRQSNAPVWCYERFGRTTTLLPDGRIVEIAGEHEDFYDPDFCIYNDVVVFDGKGQVEILGYPESVFPPTDFHSATLVGDSIFIIGCLGYPEQRKSGETPVYRLACSPFKITQVLATGEKPGWISHHTAWYEPEAHRICLHGGKVVGKDSTPNPWTYALDLQIYRWTRLP